MRRFLTDQRRTDGALSSPARSAACDSADQCRWREPQAAERLLW